MQNDQECVRLHGNFRLDTEVTCQRHITCLRLVVTCSRAVVTCPRLVARVMMYVTTLIEGFDEHARVLRRTIMRYLSLASLIVFQTTSVVVKKRFPTWDHLIEAGGYRPPLSLLTPRPLGRRKGCVHPLHSSLRSFRPSTIPFFILRCVTPDRIGFGGAFVKNQ